jgi:hypothetical protein
LTVNPWEVLTTAEIQDAIARADIRIDAALHTKQSLQRELERRCVEPGCEVFPDATWDRCAEHQATQESEGR